MIFEMSEGGLNFVTGHPCAIGEELELVWRMEDDEPPFRVQCVVRDIAQRQVGVEFLNLSAAERFRLTSGVLRLVYGGKT